MADDIDIASPENGLDPEVILRLTSLRDGKLGLDRRALEAYAMRYLLFARWLKEHTIISG